MTDSINIRLVVITLIVAALLVVAVIALLRRRGKRHTDRSGYISALYALIDDRKSDALRFIAQAVRNGENDPDAYLLLGNMLREMHQPDKALQIHRGLTVRRDLTPRRETAAKIAIAEDLAELGRLDQAVEMLESLHGARKDPDILEALHRFHHRRGDYEAAYAAMQDLSRVSEHAAPRDRGAYLTSVACLFIDEGRVEEARRFLERARKEDRHAPATMLLAARLAMESGNQREAARLWEQLLIADISHFSEVAPFLEKALFESSRFEDMERILIALLDTHQSHPLVLSRLASFYAKKGDIDRGIDLLEAERGTIARDPVLSATLAALYLQSERPDEALSILESTDGLQDAASVWRCDACGRKFPAGLGFCHACCRFGSIRKYE